MRKRVIKIGNGSVGFLFSSGLLELLEIDRKDAHLYDFDVEVDQKRKRIVLSDFKLREDAKDS